MFVWPMTLSYNSRLDKVDPHVKNQGQNVKQESAGRQMDTWTVPNVISPLLRGR